jgi:VanZ family protein
MGFIFYNSSNSGYVSQKKSMAVSNIIKEELKENKLYNVSEHSIKSINYVVRKNAHFFEYFIFAVLIASTLFTFNCKGTKAIIYILFIILFCGVLDEFYQKFIPNRTSNTGDILFDFAGGVTGVFIYYLFHYKCYEKRFK